MKLYLAGPMRGYPAFNFPAFHAAAAELRAEGHEVFSPAENDIEQVGKDFSAKYATGDEKALAADSEWTLRAALSQDCEYICAKAEGIALLPGWEKSKGANAELALARALGLWERFL